MFIKNRFSEYLHVGFSHWRYQWLGSEQWRFTVRCRLWERKQTASDNSKHSGKSLNTQSMWSILFCFYVEVKYLNILTNFSVITNTAKDFIVCMLRLGKRSICPFEEQVSPTKRKTINEKHQEGRRRVKEWICKTGEQRTFYFLGINIYTNIDSTNGGPFLHFIILFSLSGQDDAKQTQNETGNKATIYATLPTH